MATDDSSKGTTLLFVRHGAYRGDASDDDAPPEELTAVGRDQMRQVADVLVGYEPDALFCSDMPRSIESARLLREHGPAIETHHVDERLRERAFPVTEDLHTDNLAQYRREEELSDEELLEKIDEVWDAYFRNEGDGSTHVFAVHGNLIRVLCMKALELPPRRWLSLPVCHNGSITEFRLWEDERRLVAYNDRHRLPDPLRTP